jgi:EmrB/QacA subfamily drug resistance transporter
MRSKTSASAVSSVPSQAAAAAPADGSGSPPGGGLRLNTAAGRWVIFATVLGTGIVFLDGTVVNIALPTIGRDFGASLETLQWTATAYLLTLSAFILSGGSLGDRLGRRRVFIVGALWFAAASLLCALAPTAGVLIAARALQGVGGALLTPGSLAIIQASFHPEDRAQAIGLWSGLSGVSLAIGPFLGGWLIQAASWRLIFLINVPPIAAVIWVARRHVPETRDPNATGRIDAAGSALAALGLGGLIYGLIAGPNAGWTSPLVLGALIGSVVVLAAFVVLELRRPDPMLPLGMFRVRQFSGANLTTFAVYGALGGALFLVPLQLQQVLGYSPLASGVALLPVTIVMLLLSGRAGKLSQRIGPRLPMTLGPLVAGAGLALLARVGPDSSYVGAFLPAILVFSFGLVLTVAPLTAAVLSAAPSAHAGVASAVNNAVARAAGLIAVAALPAAAGITTSTYADPAAFSAGFSTAVLIAGGLAALGGVIAFVTIPRRAPGSSGAAIEPASAPPPQSVCAADAAYAQDCAGCEA